jgi:hypothetical protein
MDKSKIQEFFLKARTKTYASGGGQVKSVFPKLYQLEYTEGDLLYRDIYNMGSGLFMGLETVYYKDKPVLSLSYFGNFGKITEEETDSILRKALIKNRGTTRLWYAVELKFKNYKYVCIPAASGSIDEFSGTEKIYKDGKEVYYFYYAGGFIG